MNRVDPHTMNTMNAQVDLHALVDETIDCPFAGGLWMYELYLHRHIEAGTRSRGRSMQLMMIALCW